jgi:primosomal protein N' (replication factor Y)
MTQVAGRAGRAERPGRVVVQTFQPEHYALTCALHHDDQRFFQIESDSRRRASYPPFARIGVIRVESTDLAAAQKIAQRAAELASRAGRAVEGFRVRGPVPAPIERIKGSFRQILLLLAPTPAKLVAVMHAVKDQLDPVPRRVSLIFDVDPVDLL